MQDPVGLGLGDRRTPNSCVAPIMNIVFKASSGIEIRNACATVRLDGLGDVGHGAPVPSVVAGALDPGEVYLAGLL